MLIKTRKISNYAFNIKVISDTNEQVSIIVNGAEDIPSVSFFGDSKIFNVKLNNHQEIKLLLNNENISLDSSTLLKEYLMSIKETFSSYTLHLKKHKINNSHYLLLFDNGVTRFSVSIYADSNHCYDISINGPIDVSINGVIHESFLRKIKHRYSSELYNLIVKYQEYIGFNDNEYSIDLRFSGNHLLTMNINTSELANNNVILRYDTSKIPTDLLDYGLDVDLFNDIKNSFTRMCLNINNLGFKFCYSHHQNDVLWGWSDVIVPINILNEEALFKISEIMFEHEDFIKKCDLILESR